MLKVLLFAVCAQIGIAMCQEYFRPKNMPPTPGGRRPWPYIGHMLELPKEKAWIKFREWNEKHGPILTIWNGNTPTILIGDAEVGDHFTWPGLLTLYYWLDCGRTPGKTVCQV